MKRSFAILLTTITILLFPMLAMQIHASVNRPVVVIQSIETDPSPVTPGNEFKLKINLENEGNQSARWVTLSLTSIEGREGLGSFSVLNNDNTIHLGRIDKDEEAQGVFSMVNAGAIEPGIYNLNFLLKYTNHNGIEYESNHVTGIIIREENLLSLFNINIPSEAELDDEIYIEGEFANLGKHDIESVMIKIQGDIDISPSEYFVGTMASGDVDMFSSNAVVSKSGNIDIKIEASYTDSMNQRTVTSVDKKIQVSEPKEDLSQEQIPEEDEGFFTSIISFIKRLFGLG